MKYFIVFFAVLTVVAIDDANGQDRACLDCICKVGGCDIHIGNCTENVTSPTCGPYHITEDYWIDCGRPEGDWKQCTMYKPCSELCIRAYMSRYGKFCTGGREPTCKDCAKIHKMGPRGCQSSNDDYWIQVEECLG